MTKRFGLEAVAVVAAGLLAVGCAAEATNSDKTATTTQAFGRATKLRGTIESIPASTTVDVPIDDCAFASSPMKDWIKASFDGNVDPVHLSLEAPAPNGTTSREYNDAVLTKIVLPPGGGDGVPFAIITASDPNAEPPVFTPTLGAAPVDGADEKVGGNKKYTNIALKKGADVLDPDPLSMQAIGMGSHDNVCNNTADAKHKDWIELESISFSGTGSAGVTVQLSKGARPVFGDVNLTFEGEEADRFQRSTAGAPVNNTIIKLRRSTVQGQSMVIKLQDVLISSVVDEPATRTEPHRVRLLTKAGSGVLHLEVHDIHVTKLHQPRLPL